MKTPQNPQQIQGTSEPLTISWSGSFPQNYDDNLGPFIFGRYAEDLVKRIDPDRALQVLELACGTGQLTSRLVTRLHKDSLITATDLSPDMLIVARSKIGSQNLTWGVADMVSVPFSDEAYDLVVCQFGLMFAPDKLKAIMEMYRVLKPGGRLLINTWADPSDNKAFQVFAQVLFRLINIDMGNAEQGPFSMRDQEATSVLIREAGFRDLSVEAVCKTGEIPTASQAARGFFQGSALSVTLKEKNPSLADKISAELEEEIISQLGNNPVRSPLKAWVFQAVK